MVRKSREEDVVGESSRNVASRRGRGTSTRREPNTLPYNHFWDTQGHSHFYEDEIQSRRGRNSQPIRTIAGNDRTLCPALALELDFLEKHFFGNIARMLDYQGWNSFLKISIPLEPSMIRQFYHNLVPRNDEDETGHFVTKVYGKTIDVSSSILASYFSNENELLGAQLDGQNFNEFCPNFDMAHARKSILEPGCIDENSTFISDFTLENRLLFHILTKVIIPRSGSFTKATDFDIGVMYFLRNHIKICLGDLMHTHISGIAHNKTRSLAYAMPLTHFLIYECEVPSNPNDSILPKQMFYDEKILRLLFTQNKDTGVWERKYVAQNVRVGSVEDHLNPTQEPTTLENDPPLENPNFQTNFYPSASQDIPSSSSNPPYDPFQNSYNPLTFQSDMFSMMHQMNSRQMDFANDMRTATTRIEGRLDEQDRNIAEINDALAKMMRDYPYF